MSTDAREVNGAARRDLVQRSSGRPSIRRWARNPIARLQSSRRKYGGTLRLAAWAAVVYGTVPSLVAARAKLALLGRPPIVLVSGTYGKTTATRALRLLLGQHPDGWADFNTNFAGEVGWTILREPGRPRAYVIEIGDGAPLLGVATRYVRPDLAIVLGLGDEHLDLVASRDQLVALQAPSVAQVGPGGHVVLNADDADVRSLAELTGAAITWIGRSDGCDVRITATRHVGGLLVVELTAWDEPMTVPTRLVGDHYAECVAGVIAAAAALGLAPAQAARAWAGLAPTPGRMETMTTPSGTRIICDDYKSTPETVVAGLSAVNELTADGSGRTFAVLGELAHLRPGHADQEYARVLASATMMDRLLLLGDEWDAHSWQWSTDPRVSRVASVADAIAILRDEAGAGDTIYLKAQHEDRLRRIALAQMGAVVGCQVPSCHLKYLRCEDCSLLSGIVMVSR